MANEESSRLLASSDEYRTNLIKKNSYKGSNEYCAGHEDTISDGDNRGRDPEANGGAIGTEIDIKTRNKLMAKNSDGYTFGNQYCAGHEDTISDGDERGRDPEGQGGAIGTEIDIKTRNKLMAKNSDRYTRGNQYCAGHEDTISDGDCRGRDPENQGGCVGTNLDIQSRTCLGAKNIYKCGNEYNSSNA